MWTREELKTRGKAAFLRNYWICVVAALILTLLVGSGTSNSGNSNNDSNQTNSVGISGFTISSDNFNVESFAERFSPLGPVKFVFTVFSGIVLLVIGLAFILIRIFVLAPFEVFHLKLDGKSGTWQHTVRIPERLLWKNCVDSVFKKSLYIPLVAASSDSWNCESL